MFLSIYHQFRTAFRNAIFTYFSYSASIVRLISPLSIDYLGGELKTIYIIIISGVKQQQQHTSAHKSVSCVNNKRNSESEQAVEIEIK